MKTSESQADSIDAQYQQWEERLPQAVKEQLLQARVRADMAQMHDATPVDSELAAVYLCVSSATLKRMRSEGTGPKYQQPQTIAGTTARNQKIVYLMGELKRWLSEQTTASTMNAAELRGTMFATLQSLGTPEPFWAGEHKGVDAILGHVLATPLTPELMSGEVAHIEWIDWPEAMRRGWSNGAQRAIFEDRYRSLDLRLCGRLGLVERVVGELTVSVLQQRANLHLARGTLGDFVPLVDDASLCPKDVMHRLIGELQGLFKPLLFVVPIF